ncbi:MAG: hypothetical protein HKO54_08190 [Flavobacteriaceae bacterium]|nr:hypothetical protein [Flavobacteriaceae bacterium]
MERHKTVDAYIEKHDRWGVQLRQLRQILNKTELQEEIKWGAPSYTLDGKILLGIGAFKNHLALWFHQGVFLKDKHNKLVNAQEGKTKALRQWRFEEGDSINEAIVLEYAQECIENCLAGKELKPQRNKKVVLHPKLKEEFKKKPLFNDAFQKLTPGKQREYAEYISEAKRETTQISRLEKIIPMVLEGTGLHDKYKNC